MKRVLITGGRGFLGRNLAAHLRERKDCEVMICDVDDTAEDFKKWVLKADIVFHLAGVNRPQDPAEFESGNTGLTESMCGWLKGSNRRPKIIFSSSIQAELDNPYGLSKAKAENVLGQFSSDTGARVRIYRLSNLFGKWSRPNYNSVVATFCHNIAYDQPISISDPQRQIELSYVDDVVTAFLEEVGEDREDGLARAGIPTYRIQLGDLAGRIQAFHEMSRTLKLPDFADWFNRALYATYLSYVPHAARQHNLKFHSDDRGTLGEFVKQDHLGQIFVSRTKPGVTRGNHYHHTKTEKFFVVEGDGLIRMRAVSGGPIEEYYVSGSQYQVVDIPPGFTHSITNIGAGEMVTLFWSSEMFDPNRPDTYYLAVEPQEEVKVVSLENA